MESLPSLSRRSLLRNTALGAAALAFPAGVFAQGSDKLKVGVIGCGGRGTGAAENAFEADPNIVIWAMADAFQDRMDGSRNFLKEKLGTAYQVTDDRAHVGMDAYKAVIASDVDVIILATPPGFRPAQFKAAVDAGKHIFTEKPVAVDAPGIRTVIEAARNASSKGLNIVAGTQRRHDVAYRATHERLDAGAIGDIVAMYAYWNQGSLWMHPRQESWSDVEWQMRNWLYFTYLSGDHIAEQHVHNIDACNWAIGAHPIKATSLGGRQVRTDPAYGHVYDHFATEFEYENGVRLTSYCRQIDSCANRVSEHIVGTKGTTNGQNSIKGENAWRFDGTATNPYVEEHKHLYEAIRGGTKINEGVQVAESTLTAIMGRMAAYTGQEITWDQAMNSTEVLMPEGLQLGARPVDPVAMPGVTKFQ